jgi:hypothetical protein
LQNHCKIFAKTVKTTEKSLQVVDFQVASLSALKKGFFLIFCKKLQLKFIAQTLPADAKTVAEIRSRLLARRMIYSAGQGRGVL